MGGVEKHRFVSYLLDVQLGEEDVSKCGCTGALASVCKGKEFIMESSYLSCLYIQNTVGTGVSKRQGLPTGLVFVHRAHCCLLFVQRSYCCYVNTVNTNNTVAS